MSPAGTHRQPPHPPRPLAPGRPQPHPGRDGRGSRNRRRPPPEGKRGGKEAGLVSPDKVPGTLASPHHRAREPGAGVSTAEAK